MKKTLKQGLIDRAAKAGISLQVKDGVWAFIRYGDQMCVGVKGSHRAAFLFWEGYEAATLYPTRMMTETLRAQRRV